jgi:hypothetical protein
VNYQLSPKEYAEDLPDCLRDALRHLNMGPMDQLDSLSQMELIMILEDMLDISIPIDDLRGPLTSEVILALIKEQLSPNCHRFNAAKP